MFEKRRTDTQYNDNRHYDTWHNGIIVTLSTTVVSAIMLRVAVFIVMLSVVMPSVMLSVMALEKHEKGS
jgi:hypothetical protein